MRRFLLLLMTALFLLNTSQCAAQIFHKKKVNKSTDETNTAAPDKILYDRATDDIKHGRHEVGRLALQTLINTYPDSEYLAKAKLAIADSYFKEGGTANITQAIAGYKDFIVFFPFLPEAAYAQMQVAMAHYNEMPKADRDNTHGRDAEAEFQTFLQKYPKDPLAPEAQQRLREVQEVLAEGQFRIGYYYYVKGDRRAAAGRLLPLTKRYPLYSKSDEALWMLGDIFEKSERKDVAGSYYAQIVKNYPLSEKSPAAKDKLKSFGQPIPQPDPKALDWMTAEQNTPRPHENVLHRSIGIIHSGPDVHMAAHNGMPNMEPEGEDQNNELLHPSPTGTSSIVATQKVGEAPTGGTATSSAESVDTSSTPASTDASGSATTSAPPADGSAPPSADGTQPAADGTQKTDGTATPDSTKKESISKKKGLKKLIPW